MKIARYAVDAPGKMGKQFAIIAREDRGNCWYPLVYLQRPKWIKDDAAWAEICRSVKISLKRDFEVK